MASFYTYPHVNFSTQAKLRRKPVATESTATTLLAPFTCDRGPENTLVPIDSMSDFVAQYGELDYSNPEQRQILNIGAWLSNGGRVLACRLSDNGSKATNEIYAVEYLEDGQKKWEYFDNLGEIAFGINGKDHLFKNILQSDLKNMKIYRIQCIAKYSGEYYDDIEVSFTPTNTQGYFNIIISKIVNGNKIKLEAFRNKSFASFAAIAAASSYIGELNLQVLDANGIENFLSFNTYIEYNEKLYYAFTGTESNDDVIYEDGGLLAALNTITDFDAESIVIDDLHAVTVNFSGFAEGTHTKDSISIDTINGLTKYQYYEVKEDIINHFDDAAEYVDSPINSANTQYIIAGFELVLNGGTNGDTHLVDDVAVPIIYGAIPAGEAEYANSKMVTMLLEILKQPLETPFDCFIDCGYPLSVKKELINLFCIGHTITVNKVTSTGIKEMTFTEKRDDAFLYLSTCGIFKEGRKNNSEQLLKVYPDDVIYAQLTGSDYTNVGIFRHYEKVKDIYSMTDVSREVYVPTTYYLAGLVPYNDAINGPQWPVAGKTRGVIQNCLWIDGIPTNQEKQEYYDNHVNYIEADTNGKYIMSQLTATTDDTALKFINNMRSLLKMKKELTVLARNYLHEFNDRITKSNLQNTLNSYLANWILNRTLSRGSIEIQDYTQNDTLTNEELLIAIDIQFTGTIEIISFEITVE